MICRGIYTHAEVKHTYIHTPDARESLKSRGVSSNSCYELCRHRRSFYSPLHESALYTHIYYSLRARASSVKSACRASAKASRPTITKLDLSLSLSLSRFLFVSTSFSRLYAYAYIYTCCALALRQRRICGQCAPTSRRLARHVSVGVTYVYAHTRRNTVEGV